MCLPIETRWLLRRLSYGIIMFMESPRHEIWGRYTDKLLRGVVELPESGAGSTETARKQGYDDDLLPRFYAFPAGTNKFT